MRAEPRKMLSEKQVLEVVPVARSTLQRWVAEKAFPRPAKLGRNRVAWFADDIANWQDAKAPQ